MNWSAIGDEVSAIVGSDELKAFLLGAFLAIGVRLVRVGIHWLKNIDRGEA